MSSCSVATLPQCRNKSKRKKKKKTNMYTQYKGKKIQFKCRNRCPWHIDNSYFDTNAALLWRLNNRAQAEGRGDTYCLRLRSICIVPLQAEMRGWTAPRIEKAPKYQETVFPINMEIKHICLQRDFMILKQLPHCRSIIKSCIFRVLHTCSPDLQEEIKLSQLPGRWRAMQQWMSPLWCHTVSEL